MRQTILFVYYPVVVGLSDVAVQQSINNSILDLVYKMIDEQDCYKNPLTQITGSYELKTNERGILSLSIIIYSIFSGQAHGMTIVKSLTIDVQTGQVYQLKDLFKSGSDYVKTLSNIIKVQIRQRKIPLLVDFKTIRKDQDFYIADKALVIYFQLYELTAYVCGFLYFPISVYEIQDIIDEEGLLGRMIY
jgi:hypothetical protein